MKNYLQPYEEGNKKKYRPALIFLGVAFLILMGIGYGVWQMPYAGTILPVKIGKIFMGFIWSVIMGAVLFAFVLLTMDSKSGELVYAGKVTKKGNDYDINIEGRGTMHMRFSFELDSGKKFRNVDYKFYSTVEVGKEVEVHTTRYSGEIISIFT